jgi:FkbM family methyltransferase
MAEDNLLAKNPLWIVDVGASGGIDQRWSKLTNNYMAVLFEPDPREYEILSEKSGANMIVLNAALSDTAGAVDFHLCKKQQVSSVFLPNMDFLRKFPDVERYEVIKTISLQTDTLSNQLKSKNINEVDFIKIDTQGYELPILKGAHDFLDKVIGLELEVEFAPVYKNQPLFSEVNGFATNYGFELFDIRRYYWNRKETMQTDNQKGQLVFGDALFFRNPDQVLLMEGVSQEKIARAVYIYLAYGYVDLAHSLLNHADAGKLLDINYGDALSKTVSRHRKKNLPDFKGRYKLQRLFERIRAIFSTGGSDKSLGNP